MQEREDLGHPWGPEGSIRVPEQMVLPSDSPSQTDTHTVQENYITKTKPTTTKLQNCKF